MTSAASAERRNLRMAVLVAGLTSALGACTHTGRVDTTASIPDDYRLRHPIAIQEADQTVNIFVGNTRGGVTASRRADVIGLVSVWLREGTGAIIAEVPAGTSNARAAADSFKEVRSLLNAAGVPPRGIIVRQYHPADPRLFATIRLTYPRIAAVAGPCGVWPDDLGPFDQEQGLSQQQALLDFGVRLSAHLASMIDNPSDLVQPRPETLPYTFAAPKVSKSIARA